MQDKHRENQFRSQAKRQGLSIHKSRKPYDGISNLGGYMVTDSNNTIDAGERYSLSLDDVERFLTE